MDISYTIKAAGLKVTPQRKILYEVMAESGHGTIEEIISKVQGKNPDITVSTVYRILESFCDAKLLSRINHPNGKTCYDITPSDHHHVIVGSELIDYCDPELTELIKKNLKGKMFDDLDIDKISIQIIANHKK